MEKLDVYIDSSFDHNGTMTIGEIKIPGRRKEEYLVSTYICHPSMANDNLSGMITTALLAKEISKFDTPGVFMALCFCTRNNRSHRLSQI